MDPDLDYEPAFFARDDDAEFCPCCGALLRYRDVNSWADVGVDYCPECGFEGGIG